MLSFELLSADGAARRGRVTLDHGTVETPAFMPVGTAGTVKAVRWSDVSAAGAEIVLANTYHLMLRPGGELIREMGGLHAFVGWDRPILTDSGGFQVMSLAANRKLTEEGVLFRSHLDGSAHLLTPERAAELQLRDFGVDVAMALDECTPYPATRDEAARSMSLTHRWARRGRAAFLAARGETGRGAQFGIVQGGMHADLRRESAAAVAAEGFEGVACGGVSVGEPKEEMRAIVEATGPLLPPERPRYLMGVGHPGDLLHAVASGFDLFDCVLPTRAARHGLAYTSEGTVVLKQARFRTDRAPLDPACACPTCATASRAYLRHLFMLGEPTAATLVTVHNLHAILDLMRGIREALAARRYAAFAVEAAGRLDFGKDNR
ncbi:MAG TPA: tRNA guanosine(34) transglycosylase Tgt [Thermoanaerobaculia bacterium]|nr:tRNA guanosine(34) transglycosylase Tgt [Thermoanaerobaculia bacterium]